MAWCWIKPKDKFTYRFLSFLGDWIWWYLLGLSAASGVLIESTFRRTSRSLSGLRCNHIREAIHKKDKPRPQQKPPGVARLPYQEATSHKFSRLLSKYNIQTVHIPAKNIQLLRPAKEKLGLKTPGFYRIRCECGSVYVGQTGRTIEASLKTRDMSAWTNWRSQEWQNIGWKCLTVLTSTTPPNWGRQQDIWAAWWRRPSRSGCTPITLSEIFSAEMTVLLFFKFIHIFIYYFLHLRIYFLNNLSLCLSQAVW